MANKRHEARRKVEGSIMFQLLVQRGFKKGTHQNKKDRRARTRSASKEKSIKDFE